MKTKTCYLISGIVTAILCVPVHGEVELPLSYDRPFLIDRAYPALAAIEKLYVIIRLPDSEPNKADPVWKELKAKVEHKLQETGINTTAISVGTRSFDIPALKVDIDMLKLQDSQGCVFRIQTSLSRAVYLAKEPKLGLKADVWKAEPTIQAASVQDMSAEVANVVLTQVETFIGACRMANRPGAKSFDPNDTSPAWLTMPKDLSNQPAKRATAECKYVASKSSNVFHKLECRWAQKISPENLVVYNNRAEAIKAGKRPCKWCRP